MIQIQSLERAVTELYAAHNPERTDWADWLGGTLVPVTPFHQEVRHDTEEERRCKQQNEPADPATDYGILFD